MTVNEKRELCGHDIRVGGFKGACRASGTLHEFATVTWYKDGSVPVTLGQWRWDLIHRAVNEPGMILMA